MSTFTTSENKRLLKALKLDDERAFENIFNKMYDKLCAFINTYTKDHALAEDIVQQSMMKLWEKRKELREETNISAFLFTISRNQFIDRYRKDRKNILLTDDMHLEVILDFETETEYNLNTRRKRLNQAIENLPTKCKEVFKLRQKDNLRNKEIASYLGISEKTVEDHISRALRIIRKNAVNAYYFITSIAQSIM